MTDHAEAEKRESSLKAQLKYAEESWKECEATNKKLQDEMAATRHSECFARRKRKYESELRREADERLEVAVNTLRYD